VHTEAIGGSAGRAACGFIGTDKWTDYQANGFQGKWYAFIATTYDQGQTWTTVNATPNDPVQSSTVFGSRVAVIRTEICSTSTEITVTPWDAFSMDIATMRKRGCIAGTASNDFVAFSASGAASAATFIRNFDP